MVVIDPLSETQLGKLPLSQGAATSLPLLCFAFRNVTFLSLGIWSNFCCLLEPVIVPSLKEKEKPGHEAAGVKMEGRETRKPFHGWQGWGMGEA